MSRLLLSAALIVRDEAIMLPECLSSLEGVADEVVIVDTGWSTAPWRLPGRLARAC